MAFDKFRRAQEPADVNLVPVMNLFVVLIPFLLLSAAFYHVSVIPTSLPSQGATSGEAPEPNLKQVTVNLQVELERIVLSVSNADLPPEELEALALEILRLPDAHDVQTLSRALAEVKRRYPESDTIVLLPGDGVVYLDVVLVIDAARELVEKQGEKEKRTPLFPVVVLSKKV